MAALSFIAMYVLMYSMVDVYANAYPNTNQFYMAGLMAAPMVIFELFLMGEMYKNKKLNVTITIVSLVLLAGFFGAIRRQIAVSDEQFLKSMIPHHAGAILMCEEAPIQDPEIQELCRGITRSQQSEIDWMKAKLYRLERQSPTRL